MKCGYVTNPKTHDTIFFVLIQTDIANSRNNITIRFAQLIICCCLTLSRVPLHTRLLLSDAPCCTERSAEGEAAFDNGEALVAGLGILVGQLAQVGVASGIGGL